MKAYSLNATVVDRATGSGIAGVRVEGWDAESIFPHMVVYAETDDDGRFSVGLDEAEIESIFGRRQAAIRFRIVEQSTRGPFTVYLLEKNSETWLPRERSGPERLFADSTGSGEISSLEPLRATGKLVDKDGTPVTERLVKVFDKELRTETELAQTSTDGNTGEFSMTFDPRTLSEHGKTLPDIYIDVYDSGGESRVASTAVRTQAAASSYFHIALDEAAETAEEEGDSTPTFTRVDKRMSVLLGSIAAEELNDDEVEQLGSTAQVDVAEARAWASAEKIKGQSTTNIKASTLFGLVREGLPDDRTKLLARPASQLRSALQKAVAHRHIDYMSAEDIETELDDLVNEAVVLARDAPLAGGTCNFGDVVKLALGETSTFTKTNEFLETYIRNEDTMPTFWSELPGGPTLSTGDRDKLQTTIQFGVLTRWHLPLLENLDADTNITSFKDVAGFTTADWADRIAAMTPPTDIPGGNVTEQRANYAKLLERTAEVVMPTASLELKLTTSNDVGKFLSQNQDFQFGTRRVDEVIADPATDMTDLTQSTLLPELRKYERLVKLTPSFDSISELTSAGYTSAHEIMRESKSRFVQKMGNLPANEAEAIYDRAEHQRAAAQAVFGIYSTAVNNGLMKVVPDYGTSREDDTDPSVKLLSGWGELFGTLDQCSCKHCRSVLGPASYLVDLLDFLNKFSSNINYTGTKYWSARDVLIGAVDGGDSITGRRPEIKSVALTCTNVDTAVPYIDLVNEVLEREVSDGSFTTPYIETVGTEEDLRVTPASALTESDQTAAYDSLSTAAYPWRLPFSQWHAQTRLYLDHLGMPRHELMRLLEADSAQTAQEALGLHKRAFDIITGAATDLPHDLWGLEATIGGTAWTEHLRTALYFVEAADSSVMELRELVDTPFMQRFASQSSTVALQPEANTDGCQLDELVLQGMDADANAWTQVQQFMRLARSLGWELRRLDTMVRALKGTVAAGTVATDSAFLEALSHATAVMGRIGSVPVEEVAAWWGDIDTADTPSLDEASLYTSLFANPAVLNPVPTLTGNLVDHVAAILGATRMTERDFALLTDATEADRHLHLGPVIADGAVSLGTLSALFRHASMSRALEIPIRDIIVLSTLADIQPLASSEDATLLSGPRDTVAFMHHLDRLQRHGISVGHVHDLTRGVPFEGSTSQAQVQLDVQAVRAAVQTVEDATEPTEAVDAARVQDLLVDMLGAYGDDAEASASELAAAAASVMQVVDGSTNLDDLGQAYVLDSILGSIVDTATLDAIKDELLFRPYEEASCLGWFEPSDLTSSGGAVSGWVSRTSSGDATQTTPANQPTLVESGPFGLPAARFVGGNDPATARRLDMPDMSHGGGDHSFCFILRNEVQPGTPSVLLDITDTGRDLALGTDIGSSDAFGHYDGSAWVEDGAAETGDQIVTWVFDDGSDTASLFRNGEAAGTPGAYPVAKALQATVTLGGGDPALSAVHGFKGLVSAVGVFDVALDDDARAKVEAYLQMLAGSPATRRFSVVEDALLASRTDRESREVVKAEIAAALDVSQEVASHLLNGPSVIHASSTVMEDFLDTTVGAEADRHRAMAFLHRFAGLIRALKVDADTLRYLSSTEAPTNLFRPQDVPAPQPTWDAALLTAEAGEISLPSWLALGNTPDSAEARTVQVGPTMVARVSNTTPRAFSASGDGAGLLLEPARQNLIPVTPLSEWSELGPDPAQLMAVKSPAGDFTAELIYDDSSQQSAKSSGFVGGAALTQGANYSLSSWCRLLGAGSHALPGVAGEANLTIGSANETWARRSASAPADTAAPFVAIAPRLIFAETGGAQIWGMQLEEATYPTSFMPSGSRTADKLSVAASDALRADGRYRVTLRYAPLYASTEVSGEHDLVYFSATERVYFDGASGDIKFVAGGQTLSVAAVFARHDSLVVEVENSERGLRLRVSGAVVGDDNHTAAVTAGSYTTVHLFGDSSGVQEGVVLHHLGFSTQSVSDSQVRYAKLVELMDLLEVRDEVGRAPGDLALMLERTLGTTPTLVETTFLEELAQRSGWSLADLQVVAAHLGHSFPADYQDGTALVAQSQLQRALARLGVSAEVALGWTSVDETATDGRDTAREVLQAVRSKYSLEQWRKVGQDLHDPLREAQRDALIAYLVHDDDMVSSANDLLTKHLIDVEMSACQSTTRIKHAIASAQTFVQRILLNLEGEVPPDPDMAKEWEWMKAYRIWEANRKVFLYPENWVEPELRDDKSPLFEQFESELLQQELTHDRASDAYRRYLDRLAGIARLDIVGMVRDPGTAEDFPVEGSVLHVFGRTHTAAGPTYYHRTRAAEGRWAPWREMEIKPEGSAITPFIGKDGRLYISWLRVADASMADPKLASTDKSEPPPLGYTATVVLSHLTEDGWSSPVESQKLGPVEAAGPESFFIAAFDLDKTYLMAAKPDRIATLSMGGCTEPLHFEDFNLYLKGFPAPPFIQAQQGEFPERSEFIGGPGDPLELFLPTSTPDQYQSVSLFKGDSKFWSVQTSRVRYEALDEFEFSPFISELFYEDPGNCFYVVVNDIFEQGRDAPVDADVSNVSVKKRFNGGSDHLYGNISNVVTEGFSSESGGGGGASSEYALMQNFVSNYANTVETVELVVPRAVSVYHFQHPKVCDLIKVVAQGGLSALFRWDPDDPLQLQSDGSWFSDTFTPYDNNVSLPYPKLEFDFSLEGPYSAYNWELFFHMPFMVGARLMEEERFEEARRWFHAIFDPTDGSTEPSVRKFWKCKPFYENRDLTSLHDEMIGQPSTAAGEQAKALMGGDGDKISLERQIAAWRRDPFNPHLLARMRPVAYQKATVIRYLDNIIAWADRLFRRFTMESVNEALQLYILAQELLGPRPRLIDSVADEVVESYDDIKDSADAFGNAVLLENLMPVGTKSVSTWEEIPPPPVIRTLKFCIPPNERVLGFWDTIEDRLFKIRNCQDIEGVERSLAIYEPPIDPGLLVRARAAGLDLSSVLDDRKAPPSVYRFEVLRQTAMDFAQSVQSLGSALLSAIERRDGETLAQLRQTHEVQVSEMSIATRREQVEEAREALEGVRRQRRTVENRYEFYRSIEHISAKEALALDESKKANELRRASEGVQAGAAVARALPDTDVGLSGWGAHATLVFGGSHLGSAIEAVSRGLSGKALIHEGSASATATVAGYDRRYADWKLQERTAELELAQLDKQIVAAEIRVAIAENELATLERQLRQSEEVDSYLRTKFSNDELYSWMTSRLSQTYFQAYKLAFDMAKRAERAFQFERGEPERTFVKFGYWDGRRKGLLAGENLMHDLRRMQAAYLEENRREYEVVKHVSLAELFPEALVVLREEGVASIRIDEASFDRDYPGHFMRRIKSVSMSIPAIAGPHSGVHCKLSLLRSEVRRTSVVGDEGYESTGLEDERFIHDFGVRGAVCTSAGQNDAGVFQLDFQDSRYLPFEGAGAVSEWRIEMDPDTNTFDLHDVSDVVLHISYMAREGGGALRDAAKAAVLGTAPRKAKRLFSLKHEFSAAWETFLSETVATNTQQLSIEMEGKMPYIHGRGEVRVVSYQLAAVLHDDVESVPIAVTLPQGSPASMDVLRSPLLRSTAANGEEAEGVWQLQLDTSDLPTTEGLLDPDILEDLILIVELERDPPVK